MKLRKLIALLLAFALSLSFGGCGLFGGEKEESAPPVEESSKEEEEPDPEYPVSAGGIELLARPGAVVSLAPALTEKLYNLGMEDRLAGVSDYCDYPDGVRDLPACGTAQLPDVEAIAALSPHLVLTSDTPPAEVLDALGELDIPVAVFPRAESVDALMEMYVDIARLMEGDISGGMIGESVAGEFRARLDAMRQNLAAYTEENGRKKALYLRLLDFTVATGDTFENELLDSIGLDNIAAPYTGWEYPAEEAKSADGQAVFAAVDVIFMDEDFVTIKNLEQNAFYKGLPATIQDRYEYISAIVMERQSIRTLDLLEEMAYSKQVYPDAAPAGYAAPDEGAGPETEESAG